MFEELDILFPTEISNYIASFLCDGYIVDPRYQHRIYYKRKDHFNLLIPKPIFEKTVWMRRYRNPYMGVGIKLYAYKFVKLPWIRLQYLITRSNSKLECEVMCDCVIRQPNHWIIHYVHSILEQVESMDRHESKIMGLNITIPYLVQLILPIINDNSLNNLRSEYPSLAWKSVDKLNKIIGECLPPVLYRSVQRTLDFWLH